MTVPIPSAEALLAWYCAGEIDDVEDFDGYLGAAFYAVVADVVARLRDEHPAFENLSITWASDTDGTIGAALIEYGVKDEALGYFYLSKFVEVKHLTTDREATGLDGVLAIIKAVRQEYVTLSRYVEERGL